LSRLKTCRIFYGVNTVKATAIAKEVANYLREQHGATRVLLFGSLATGKYRLGSDIDIYFEGVPPGKAGAATGFAMVTFPNAPLDLWPDDCCAPFFKSEALTTGIPL
jgi:Nucleotidyltransferase domain